MTSAIGLTLGGLVALYLGAEALVRGSSALALRVGLSPLVIGLTVVAFGTSSPELAVSVRAALAGQGDIAVGNVVGSNVANIALILGICALIRPLRVHAQVVRWDAPIMLACSGFFAFLLSRGGLGRGAGGVLVGGLVAYTALGVWLARREPLVAVRDEFAGGLPAAPRSVAGETLLVAAGLAGLVLGGQFLVTGAVSGARSFGVSEAVIGLTLVAVGTSLPELATSLVAALRGEADIAVGNVVGSNIFNLLGVAGGAALARPLVVQGVGWEDLAVMVFLAAAAVPILWTGARVSRREGLCLFAAYCGYVAWRLI